MYMLSQWGDFSDNIISNAFYRYATDLSVNSIWEALQAAEDSPNGTGYNAEGFNQALSDAFSAVIYDYNNNYTGGGEEEEEEMPCASLMTFGYFMQAMDDFVDDVDERRGSVLALQAELGLSDAEAEELLEYPSIIDWVVVKLNLTPEEGLILEAETSGQLLSTVVSTLFSTPVNENDDPPGCEGCSVGEAQIVLGDNTRARDMLDCAIEKLSNYDGTNPSDVKDALFDHFWGTSNELIADFISFNLKFMKFTSGGATYKTNDIGEGLCGATTNAWSYPTVQFTAVRLCRPIYWNQSAINRSTVIIHEWMHLYHGSGDLAYIWDSAAYNNLTTWDQLANADSYAQFVKQLCP